MRNATAISEYRAIVANHQENAPEMSSPQAHTLRNIVEWKGWTCRQVKYIEKCGCFESCAGFSEENLISIHAR